MLNASFISKDHIIQEVVTYTYMSLPENEGKYLESRYPHDTMLYSAKYGSITEELL